MAPTLELYAPPHQLDDIRPPQDLFEQSLAVAHRSVYAVGAAASQSGVLTHITLSSSLAALYFGDASSSFTVALAAAKSIWPA